MIKNMGRLQFSRLKPLVVRHRTILRSVMIFIVLIGLWSVFYPRIMDARGLDWLMQLIAGLTTYLLWLLGNPVNLNETVVASSVFSMQVGNECTGIVPAVILIAAVIAYPSSLLKKILCLGLGIPVIFLINLVRTVSLYYVGVHIPQYFDISHFVVWQSITILVVIGIWLLWIGKVVNVRPS